MSFSVDSLVGLRVWGLAHAAETPMLQIGERKVSTSPLGRERITGDYALHIQCPWTIDVAGLRQDSITHLDVAKAVLTSVVEQQPRIIAAQEDSQGALHIEIEGDIVLELVSAACRAGEEAWRLFRPDDDLAHLVRHGDGTRRE